ncbi:MAG: FadR family transcriptional regulator [Syntrophobacterales bacterium]|jgi:GntR family transcriptional repressor for pyruvate dehydrogenase complex|nr:FadR family transcriptional regulator [Syntrophobacterales bacterium]
MLKEVKKKRAYEDIVIQIRTLIEKGRMKLGDQLPNEKELSEIFKVSRSTLREAILSLENMNLVERRQGNGTYVVASSEKALIAPLAQSLVHEEDDIIDIFALRKIIEPEIAQLVAENRSPRNWKELEKILDRQSKELEDGLHPIQTDSGFHYTIAKMAKNKILERLLVALVGLTSKIRDGYMQSDERKKKSIFGHREIVAALKNGDGTAAKKAMLHHLQEVENTLYKNRGGGKRS